MKSQINLSPLGTARANVPANTRSVDPETDLLAWLARVRARLNDLYNLDDKIAFIAWELARWQPGLNLPERQTP